MKGLINFASYAEFADHFQDQLLCEDEVKTWTGNYCISTAACKDFETRLARNYASYYAPMAWELI